MAEKTYVVAVAHENMAVGQTVTVEEGQEGRLESLLGAGYYFVKNVAYPVVEVELDALEAEDESDSGLLERFEEQDVVEVVAEKPRRRRSREDQ